MDIYHYYTGSIPIIVSIPHAGTFVPEDINQQLTPDARKLTDTDWHVEKLYAFVRELNIHLLVATHSRYVVDLNRDPSGQSLYPGKFTTGLCPTTTFDDVPLYNNHFVLTEQVIQKRITTYWQPYHDKLQAIIKNLHGAPRIILFDAHSIRSLVPTLFAGQLPDLNIGTADGLSANQDLTNNLFNISKESSYSVVTNGRFKGGYITRHYGNPAANIHAIQLELAQHNYMQENFPFHYAQNKAEKLQETLQKLFYFLIEWLKC